jgi:4-hydroxybenzoate polyprenyltransferase
MVFSREEGYFTGSMYISYTIAVTGILIVAGLLHLTVVPRWPLTWLLGLASIFFAPLVPASFRYARILWIHLDRALEP